MNSPSKVAQTLAWALLPGLLAAQPPALSSLLPAAAPPGQTVDVTLHGERLSEPKGLWTSFPARVELVLPDPNGQPASNQVTFRITLPRTLQVGIGALRLITNQGASNLQLFMLDDLPSAARSGNNHTPATAQDVTLPIAVDGVCDALQSDIYQFHAQAGEMLSIEVVSQRLGLPLDPVVSLLDESGRQLAFSDDEPGLGADSRFLCQIPADGRYFLELHDVRNRGGAGYGYRLRMGRFPLATVAFPLGGRAGSVSTFEVAGPAVQGILPINIELPRDVSSAPLLVGVRSPESQASGFVAVVAGASREILESEPNDQMEQATAISVPCAINGRLDKPQDRDTFSFEAKKGEPLAIIGRGRSLGAPTDLLLRLFKPDGSLVGEAEDAGKEEGVLRTTIPEDGTYRLVVEELLNRSGPEYAYRIEVERSAAGYSLAVDGDSYQVPQGGTFASQITASRTGYQGPIELSVEGLGSDLVLEGHVIAQDGEKTELKVTLPTHLEPGQLQMARIVGRATQGNDKLLAAASTMAALRKALPHCLHPPQSLDGWIAIGIGPVFPPFFQLSLESQPIYFPQLIGSAPFKVKVERLNGEFKDPIALVVEGLPEGFTAEVKPEGEPALTYVVTLKGPESPPEAMHAARLVGVGTFKLQTRRVVLEAVPLQIVKPLLVAVEPGGPIAAGGKQKAKVRVTRFGEEKNTVIVTWKDGPTGIVAPIRLEIAGDQTEVAFELAAATDAPRGEFASLVAVATTTVKGQNLVVESPAAKLVVQDASP